MAKAVFLLLGCLHLLPPTLGLHCPPSVTAFSSDLSPRHYYKCAETDRTAVLTECKAGELYSTKLEICVKTHGEPEPMDIDALGRNVQLGSLYDARTGMFFPEASLWTKETIQNNAHTELTPRVTAEVSTAQTVYEKHRFMDIEAELSLNFMDGAVDVSGSARYMSDKVEAESEVNVALKYHQRTHFSYINIHTPPDFLEECTSPLYTHLVTSVTYGVDCFFVFKRQTQSGESQTNVEGKLDITVNKIPGVSISGGGEVNLTSVEREILNTTNIRMFGDFSPETRLPANFDGAIQFYRDTVPNLVGPDLVGATPLKVGLTPFLKDVCTAEGNILNDINNNMISDLRRMLDDLERLDMKVGALLVSDPAKAFKPLRENLSYFRTKLRAYTLQQKQAMQEILPEIKAGTGAEVELSYLLGNYTESKFYYGTCSIFLDARTREVKAIEFLVKSFEAESNIGMADYEDANDVEYIFQRDMVIVMDLNILTNKSLIENYLNDAEVDESNFWFNDNHMTSTVGSVVRKLHKFGMANLDLEDRGYLLKITSLEEAPYYTTALLNGALISNQFEFPTTPKKPEISDRSNDMFSFTMTVQAFTLGCRVTIRDSTSDWNIQEDIPFPEEAAAGDDVLITVPGMTAGHVYNISVTYLTAVGESEPSPGSQPFNTPATSAPRGLTTSTVTESSLALAWLPPKVTAEGIDSSKIVYIVTVTGGDTSETKTTTDLEIIFEGLEDSTEFSVSMVAQYDLALGIDDEVSDSASVSLTALTSPLPPTLASEPTEVSLHSASLSWTPPAKLGAPLLHYVLFWTGAGGPRSRVVREEHTEVTDLAMGEIYIFNVKVVTTASESNYSKGLIVKTPYEQTDIGELRDEVFGAIDDAIDAIRQEIRFCAIKSETNVEGVIAFDSLFTSINTVDYDEGQWMDPKQGVFHARQGGVYRVRLSLEMSWPLGKDHTVSVMVNDQVFATALHTSHDADALSEYASWDSLIPMKAGDSLSINHHTDGSLPLTSVILCVSSENWE